MGICTTQPCKVWFASQKAVAVGTVTLNNTNELDNGAHLTGTLDGQVSAAAGEMKGLANDFGQATILPTESAPVAGKSH